MEQILSLFNQIYPLSEALRERLISCTSYREVGKGELILRQGQVCHHVFFLERGMLRCFYTKHDAEICSWFLQEGDLVVSPKSFFNRVPSHESIQAMEPSAFYYIRYEDLQALYRDFLEMNFVGRVLTEKYYLRCDQRLYALMMERATEKFQYIATHYPQWLKRVPDAYMSSYLGITNVWFSKIKAQNAMLLKS